MTGNGQNRTALVLSGGGSLGAFAVGAVRSLYRRFRHTGWFSIVGGCSTGALISPFAALLGTPEVQIAEEALAQMVEQYSTVTTGDILERRSPVELLKDPNCLYRSTPLRQRLTAALRPQLFDRLRSEDAPCCYVVYTNYQTGCLEVASPRDPGMSREGFLDAMMASASVPMLMEPTVIAGQYCLDGGVRDLVPFTPAIDLGAEVIVPVVLRGTIGPVTGAFRRGDQVLLRTLAIMQDRTGKSDLRQARLVNLAVRARGEVLHTLAADPRLGEQVRAVFEREEYRDLFGSGRRLVRLIEGLHPDEELTRNPLRFDPVKMRAWIELGERKAESVLPRSPFMPEPAGDQVDRPATIAR